MLIEKGADMNLRDKDGNTPLIVAVKKEHETTVQALVEKGANINAADIDMNSPLLLSCLKGEIKS